MDADGVPTLPVIASSRIAVCIVGATRTLLLSGVYKSIKKNLLDSQLVPVDVFLHLHLGWDSTNFAPGMGHHGAAGESISDADLKLQRVVKLFNPVETRLQRTSDCNTPPLDTHPVCRGIARHRGMLPSEGDLAGFLQYMWVLECQRCAPRTRLNPCSPHSE